MGDSAEVKAPRGEELWTTYYNKKGCPILITTSKVTRDCYFLYEIADMKLTKLGKASSPLELEEKFKVKERMGCV